ncbi:outer membrane protein assembly factor BamB family protein [Natronorubrum sulfidifaciens]|uniref:outer membrane protein assembly factor BamB family protein n=1 Tax=Natronorubrum sulfidifaciens TaxID=388259 RepID=UPI001375F443|nr:PQQ-binding-like beta-propeller repeat protein [Natronorubrum sulfidifaciens]
MVIYLSGLNEPTMGTQLSQTRRRWLETCATVAGMTAIAGCSGSDENGASSEEDSNEDESLGSDWPMYGVDLQNTGYHPNARGPESETVTTRAVMNIDGHVPFPLSIADKVAYLSSTGGVSGDAKLYAVDLDTEEILWEEEGFGAPNVHDGIVYGPTGDGQIHGFDAETGDRWRSEEIESIIGLGGPVPTESGIIVASHERIWKIDPDTGEYTTVTTTPDFVGGSTDWPAFHNDVFYIARSSNLYAVNIETSEIEWTFKAEQEGRLSDSNPAVANGCVYLTGTGRDNQLYAIDADSGEKEWSIDTKSEIKTSPAVSGNHIYIGDTNRLIAVDNNNGTIEWETTKNITGRPSDVVISNDTCYASSQFGIFAFNASSGTPKWSYTVDDSLDGGFTAPPTLFDGTVYIPANDNKLYAIEDA